MTLQTDKLRIGYALPTKLTAAAAASLGWWLALSNNGDDLIFSTILPGTFAIAATLVLVFAMRSGISVDEESLTQSNGLRSRTFARETLLGLETIDDALTGPSLLLRFRDGVVIVSRRNGMADPDAVRRFIQEEWRPGAMRRPTAGPVEGPVIPEYEPLHVVLLCVATLGFSAAVFAGPLLWACIAPAFLAARTLWRVLSAHTLRADATGISATRFFGSPVTLRWQDIRSVRYWHSLAHGGMAISDGKMTLRIYRFIGDYPRLNRYVQDHAPSESMPLPLQIPCTIALDRRRLSSVLVLLLTAGAALWLALQDAWPAAFLLLAAPSALFAYTALSSGRRLEIAHDHLRLIERRAFSESAKIYKQADLTDMRIARQLTAGGLWLTFGDQRLEIGNLDSSKAPEELLIALKKQWRWESLPTATQPETSLDAA